MKDKETILVSHEKIIRKITIKNNKMIFENYLSNIYVYNSGKIIN